MYSYAPPRRLAQVVVPAAPAVAAPVVAPPSPSPLAGAPVPEGLFWTALAGAAAWGAIRTGVRPKESTFMRAVGWGGGIAAGLAALVGLTGILSPATARTLPVRWYWVA